MIRLVVLIALLIPRSSHAEPTNGTLVGVGVGLALPTYMIGVTMHESSHALAAILVGATVDELHLFPPGRDPHVHVFRFGWTYVHGLATRREKIFFYVAPKITDALMLGGFSALAFTDAWPANRYGALALTVLATGFWIDFAKDILLFGKNNDIVKAFDLWCFHGWRQIPARVVYATAAAGLGLLVARGYARTFDRDDATTAPRIAPLWAVAF